jgi:hypothetical protein
LFHGDTRTEEQTDRTKLIVAFRNFAKGPKNDSSYLPIQRQHLLAEFCGVIARMAVCGGESNLKLLLVKFTEKDKETFMTK